MSDVPDEFPDDLYLMIGSGDLELGKARVDSLISGIHLPDCPECYGSPEAINEPPPKKLSREFIWEKYLMWKELA